MRIYLAAPYGSRESIRLMAGYLDLIGHECTSSWLVESHEINAGTQGAATALPDEQVAQHAADDFADIDRSDVLVLFTAAYVGVEGGGGRHVETGYAIARGIPVIVVGEPENVFHRGAGCRLVADWVHALRHIERMSECTVSDVEPELCCCGMPQSVHPLKGHCGLYRAASTCPGHNPERRQ